MVFSLFSYKTPIFFFKAIHHGDLLPIGKEIVEILFSTGLIKVKK